MFDPVLFAINGALCAAALGCAAFVHPGRNAALMLAALLCVNFVFCNLAYTPFAPKLALAAVGIHVTSKKLWMLADALCGTVAAATMRWWGWVLWALAILQICIHGGYDWGLYSAEFYTDRLADVLHAQIALFFVIGGPGCVAFLHRHVAGLWRNFAIPTTASAAAPARRDKGGE